MLSLRVGVGLDVLAGGVGADLGVLGVGVDRDVLAAWFAVLFPFCVSPLRSRVSASLTILAAPTVSVTRSLGAVLSPSLLSFSCARCFSSSFSSSLFC